MTVAEQSTVETARQAEAEQTRLSTAQGLVYKAYSRPYSGGSAKVLNLYASGFYGDAPWTMFFVRDPSQPNRYKLMEIVPNIVYFIVSYYTAAYSSQIGLPDLGDTVTIVDASGEHTVKVEPLG